MGKYVAVGILAVIVLAAVTYESPERATQPGSGDERRVEGRFTGLNSGGTTGGEAERVMPGGLPAATGSAATGGLPGLPPAGPSGLPGLPAIPSLPPNGATLADGATGAASAQQPNEPEAGAGGRGGDSAADDAELPKEVEYTVKAGQTLSDIAREVLGDPGRWRTIYERNKERIPDPDRIRQGMTLLIATADAAERGATERTVAASAPRAAAAAAPAGGRTYTVAKGDTLYSIASRELGQGTRWREIVSLNGLASEQVAAGTRIALPAR